MLAKTLQSKFDQSELFEVLDGVPAHKPDILKLLHTECEYIRQRKERLDSHL